MQLHINGSDREVEATTIAELLNELGYSERVATALNEVFVPKSARSTTQITDGDRVEVLAPMQGG